MASVEKGKSNMTVLKPATARKHLNGLSKLFNLKRLERDSSKTKKDMGRKVQ